MGFCPLLAIFKKILANLSGFWDYKRKLRIHSVQNGQSGFWMLVLIELGTTTNLPTDRLVSAAVVAVATHNSCWKLVWHKAMSPVLARTVLLAGSDPSTDQVILRKDPLSFVLLGIQGTPQWDS